MGRIRLGAVSYLNARPLVYGLEQNEQFSLRFDVPARCADLLHACQIDLGLIPSIEYLRGPGPYRFVPGLSVSSRGPVASVAIYTRREPRDIRSIALDTTSRTSVALTQIAARQAFGISPELIAMLPDLDAMLQRADAALIIGDKALLLDHDAAGVQKIDLGELWSRTTGLPFVYAFWAGRPDVVDVDGARLLKQACARGLQDLPAIASAYYPDNPGLQTVAEGYLRDNIRYGLDTDELEGLRTFYRYASELGLVSFDGELRFYHAERD